MFIQILINLWFYSLFKNTNNNDTNHDNNNYNSIHINNTKASAINKNAI